eukprot:14196153-Alexandrium_andersonii.AAC.1
MSASLVGSEMCIRDSSNSRPRTPSSSRPRTSHSGSRARSSEASLRRLGSVSYTHLTLPTICSV